MSEPLSPDLERKAQDLAARITTRSAEAVLAIARRLVASTDETLFGETEFAIRDHALGVVADAYTEHLKKKAATPAPPSTAPIATDPPPSTTTARARSKASAARSHAAARTTTAPSAVTDSAPGTPASASPTSD